MSSAPKAISQLPRITSEHTANRMPVKEVDHTKLGESISPLCTLAAEKAFGG